MHSRKRYSERRLRYETERGIESEELESRKRRQREFSDVLLDYLLNETAGSCTLSFLSGADIVAELTQGCEYHQLVIKHSHSIVSPLHRQPSTQHQNLHAK